MSVGIKMAEQDGTTNEMIDGLLRFLPGFEEPKRQFIEKWEPYPVYAADVTEFFKMAGYSRLMDRDYQIHQAGEMLYDDGKVQAASLGEIRKMLTFCVRGERFSDGHWGRMLADGRIQALLQRLQIVRDEMDS